MKKTFVFIILLFPGINSNCCHAQNAKSAPNLTIGDDIPDHTSYEQFLAKPKINCKLENCSVTSFVLNIILPNHYIYEYQNKGSELNRPVRDSLEKFRSQKIKCKVLIEKIKVNHNGKEMLMGTNDLEYFLE